MVKLEHANLFFSRSAPDPPPGFPPAVESSRNLNPTSKENEMHQQRQSRDFCAEKPPRRTSRKISRPKFYEPPSPRRLRGRPPKARLLSQFSAHEAGNSNELSSTPSPRPKKRIPTSLQMTTEQPNNLVAQETNMNGNTPAHKKRTRTIKKSTFLDQETLSDISLAQPSVPVKRARKVGKRSEGINPKILQHVANALQYRTGSVEGKNVNLLKAINKKHGDITQDCSLESDCMKTLVLLGICKVVQDLQKKRLKDLDVSSLDSCYAVVRDAENMKVNVEWLHNRLDEIKNAVRLNDEAKGTANERDRHLEIIGRKEKQVERLKSQVEDIQGKVAQEMVMVEELNKRLSHLMSEISRFQDTFLMDGLL